ncbi:MULTISPECIES: citrate lyase acyl carrier protein [Sulfurospirillum]|uniref:Citrate lyase acyl carrier protein n=3 Tax=Sulfurospirillum TaxID=57665 RepID=A0A1D7TLI4_9BACT|nr:MULTISPECIES: citrate lyase acyl carrier protein [Sulfurospirillum]AHJ13595.1 citrate lyase gamma chain, acyl carrier protein [Sulfurospirillum multivorans DSM 12446]AOO65859.1 citrate lyase gamma chain, acyl carrier protein [Sulfurospirillum halorespirans DSM 13726]QEH07085.1 citrate lyase gamma chain, acyl carrier protein [Sulfurospirillum multivorans]
MSKKLETAHAGTLESSDAFVRVIPVDVKGIEIELESSVEEIYGDAIRALVLETAMAMGVEGVKLIVQDKGALDYVIKARVQTAILRALGEAEPDWSVL